VSAANGCSHGGKGDEWWATESSRSYKIIDVERLPPSTSTSADRNILHPF
jgi:hypothetical protein